MRTARPLPYGGASALSRGGLCQGGLCLSGVVSVRGAGVSAQNDWQTGVKNGR